MSDRAWVGKRIAGRASAVLEGVAMLACGTFLATAATPANNATLANQATVANVAAAANSATPATPPSSELLGDPGQFALIVNGDDSFTHNYNVAMALTALSKLGYTPEHTFVLAPARQPPIAAWQQPATGHGLRQALALLHTRLRPGDQLLVYLTGHGYRVFGHTMLGLASGSISDRDLMGRLAELPFGKLILIADQCYSGGFVNAAVALGRNVVAVSSTDDRHEVRCEPWVRPLWLAAQAAADAADAAGVPGEESLEAAFQVAAEGVRRSRASAAEGPRYAASGTCAGHGNRFSAAPRRRWQTPAFLPAGGVAPDGG